MNPQLVKCPECGTSARFDASNPHRPFCSERCKLMDLGAWASESYRVAGSQADEDLMSGETGEDQPRLICSSNTE